MGYFKVSPGIAIVSFGLLALAACQEASRTEKQAGLWPPGQSEIVICPGDRRCGQEAPSPDIRAASCRVNQTRLKFKCGEQDLPCPGAGCPTGEPGLPDQKCWISETFVDVRCPSSPTAASAPDEAAPAPSEPAAPAAG
jgi:hypothetical protein